jgi:hypothetical protein
VVLEAVGYENVRWMELSQEFVYSWAFALMLNLDLKLPEFIDWSGGLAMKDVKCMELVLDCVQQLAFVLVVLNLEFC